MRYLKRNISDLIAWFILLSLVVSCRSPEQLLEKAIKKKPDLITEKLDTITLTKFEVDSIPVFVGDTVIFEKIVKQVEYDTVIPNRLILLEKRKTRKEIRKNKRLEKIRLKLEADLKETEAKYKFKIDRLTKRLEAKEERQENRQESKERRSNKFWIGFFLGILSTLAVFFIIRYVIHKAISIY